MIIFTVIAIVIGLLMCLLGYKIFRVWLTVSGLILGAQLGFSLGERLGGDVWPLVGAIVFGLLLALLAYFLFKVGAVIIGMLTGAWLSALLLDSLGISPIWWVTLLGAIAVGITAGVYLKNFIVAASSLLGSYLVVGGIYALVTNQYIYQAQSDHIMLSMGIPWYLLLVVIVLAVFAATAQFSYNKNTPDIV